MTTTAPIEYATLGELKARHAVTHDRHDAAYQLAILAASEAITNTTGRQFSLSHTVEPRLFRPRTGGLFVDIDDIDSSNLGTVAYSSTGRSGTFIDIDAVDLAPMTVNGSSTVSRLEYDGAGCLPYGRRAWVRVTPAGAGWGWLETPPSIVEATLLYAARLFKRRDTPESVVGFEGAGVGRISNRDPDVMELVGPWCRVAKWAP